MTFLTRKNLTLATALLFSSLSQAHDNATLDAMASPHGGVVRMAGAYHLELLLKPNQALLFITDHGGKSIATQGGNAELTLLGKQKSLIQLKATTGNQLQGNSDALTSGQYRAVVKLKLPGQEEQMAQFSGLAIK